MLRGGTQSPVTREKDGDEDEAVNKRPRTAHEKLAVLSLCLVCFYLGPCACVCCCCCSSSSSSSSSSPPLLCSALQPPSQSPSSDRITQTHPLITLTTTNPPTITHPLTALHANPAAVLKTLSSRVHQIIPPTVSPSNDPLSPSPIQVDLLLPPSSATSISTTRLRLFLFPLGNCCDSNDLNMRTTSIANKIQIHVNAVTACSINTAPPLSPKWMPTRPRGLASGGT